MRHLPPLLLAAVLACVATRPAPAQTPPAAQEDVITGLERMRDAFGSGNQADLLRHLESVDRLTSNHPIIIYQIARTRAALSDTAGALAALERLAPMGLAAPIARDSAFRILHSHPDFGRIAAHLARAAAPLVRSDTAFVAADPDLIPESVAYDPVERAWYLGSLARHKVVRVGADGSARDFAVVEGKGRVIGIKIDAPRRRLWMVETTIDGTAPRTWSGTGGWTSLRGYDLATGREIARHAPADRERPHLFNDLAVSAAGDVYVTDLFGNAVWRLRPDADSLEMLARGPRFHWPNGITLSPDESRLYVAHLEGISTVDPRTGALAPLPHPPAAAMADIDGLYACGTSLIAIQRMADFQQVSRFVLSPSGDSIVAMEAVERGHPAYVDPTTGVMVGGDLFYIANSQFRRLAPDHTLAPAPRPHGTVILRLPGICR
ncbi:MAG TPA: hypothetical protein VFR81_20970 [Longimicrobium sp.]|nr:hypothetical protein [Longimicrobium sp.]